MLTFLLDVAVIRHFVARDTGRDNARCGRLHDGWYKNWNRGPVEGEMLAASLVQSWRVEHFRSRRTSVDNS